MPALTVHAIVDQLHGAGLNLSLAPAGGLAVAPSSQLTAELRTLIRSSKSLLIDWLTTNNDVVSLAPDPSDSPANWRELARTYHAHHFNCQICIAAGRGSRFGLRCGVGAALWYAYNQ